MAKLVFEAKQDDAVKRDATIDIDDPNVQPYTQELRELPVGTYTIKVSAIAVDGVVLSEASQPDVAVRAGSLTPVDLTLSFDNINTVPVTYTPGGVAVAVSANVAPTVTIDPSKIEITKYTPPKGDPTFEFIKISFEADSSINLVDDGGLNLCTSKNLMITVARDYIGENGIVESMSVVEPSNTDDNLCTFRFYFLKSTLSTKEFEILRITVNAQNEGGGTGSASVEFRKTDLPLN